MSAAPTTPAPSTPATASSLWLSGHSSKRSIRPASVSDTPRLALSCEEPVTRNRPGRSSVSTAAFSAISNSGTRCTSSMARSPGRPIRKPRGSAAAATRASRSSRETYTPFGESPTMRCTSVDLPACRGPTTPTTRVSASASMIRGWRDRRTSKAEPSIRNESATASIMADSHGSDGGSAGFGWRIRGIRMADPRPSCAGRPWARSGGSYRRSGSARRHPPRCRG